MSRQKNLATMALLTISGWAVQSTAFSIPNEYRLKRPANFRSIETQTPLNLLLPSSPLSSMSKCPQKYLTTRMAAASTQLVSMRISKILYNILPRILSIVSKFNKFSSLTHDTTFQSNTILISHPWPISPLDSTSQSSHQKDIAASRYGNRLSVVS